MSIKAYQGFSTRKTPQHEPIPGREQEMVLDSAGGYVFPVDDWQRLDRFLVLGSEGGSYYVKERELTRENAKASLRCVKEDGSRAVGRIAEVSEAGRAPKNDPALFALAMAMKLGDLETRKAAAKALPRVARIGTHLFHFAAFLEQFGGWGRLTREAVAAWYNDMDADRLAYQAVKYQQRDGWSHRDLLRLSHPKPRTEEHDAIYRYATKGEWAEGAEGYIAGFEAAKRAAKTKEVVQLILLHGLTREMVPTQFLQESEVWDALLTRMPMGAMVRNLGKMTEVGLVKPMSNAAAHICKRLTDVSAIMKSRIHPLAILIALKTYKQGHGMRGKLKWDPMSQVVDALDGAFYAAFGNVAPTGKRTMLAIDVSGSMAWPSSKIAGTPLVARDAAGAMAMVTARVEPNYVVTAFSNAGTFSGGGRDWYKSGIAVVPLSPRQRLDDVVQTINGLPAAGTDCTLPMLWATHTGAEIDTFVIYTDNETWAGDVHPCQALVEYRRKSGIPARLVVVGMVSNGFTIADPNDAGTLDVVGFDTATPQVISDFSAGDV